MADHFRPFSDFIIFESKRAKKYNLILFFRQDSETRFAVDDLVGMRRVQKILIQNVKGAKYLVSFSSCSLKTREKYISFTQYVKIKHNCEFYHSKIEK